MNLDPGAVGDETGDGLRFERLNELRPVKRGDIRVELRRRRFP